MDGYGYFANYYDYLNSDTDYKQRADYLLSLFKKYDGKPHTLLDLGCGTGSLSLELLNRGVDVIGVDGSVDMLSVAREKMLKRGLDVLLLCQDLTELDLYGDVDGCVCVLDTLNHITDIDDLETVFKRVQLFVRPDGLFVFDLNTHYKHREILANNSFVYDTEEVYFVWQNEIDGDKVYITLDMFVPKDDLNYERFSESFCERAYSDDEICRLALKCGFEVLERFDDLSFTAPNDSSQKITYILKRKG